MAKKVNKPVADIKPLKRVELEIGILGSQKIPFRWMSEKYGHAEFIVCVVYRRGFIREAFITPAQQIGTECYYHIKGKWHGLHIGGYVQNISENKNEYHKAWVWCSGYCSTHKGVSYRMYVPKYAGSLHVSTGLGSLMLNWGSIDEVSIVQIKEMKKPVRKRAAKKKK